MLFRSTGDNVRWQSELTDNWLGLPNANCECKSYKKKIKQDCEGHFGHIVLPTSIYHPNYVPEIVRILNQICLKCFELRQRKDRTKLPYTGLSQMKEELNSPTLDYLRTMWIEKHDDDGENVFTESIWKDTLQSRWPQSHSSIKKDRVDVKTQSC